MLDVHNVFYVSMLKKYEPDPSCMFTLEELLIRDTMTYVEESVKILDRKKHTLRRKVIPIFKVCGKNHTQNKPQGNKKKKYGRNPHLFD